MRSLKRVLLGPTSALRPHPKAPAWDVCALDLGRAPLEEEAIADRQQRWAQEQANEAEGEDAADEPEAEHHGQVGGLVEEIGPEDIVDATDKEQTPCRDEDAPPNGSLDKEPQRYRAPHQWGAHRHERQDKCKEAEQYRLRHTGDPKPTAAKRAWASPVAIKP